VEKFLPWQTPEIQTKGIRVCLATTVPFRSPIQMTLSLPSQNGEKVIRGPQGRITKAAFQFRLGDDWLKGAKMVRELDSSSRFPGTKEA